MKYFKTYVALNLANDSNNMHLKSVGQGVVYLSFLMASGKAFYDFKIDVSLDLLLICRKESTNYNIISGLSIPSVVINQVCQTGKSNSWNCLIESATRSDQCEPNGKVTVIILWEDEKPKTINITC